MMDSLPVLDSAQQIAAAAQKMRQTVLARHLTPNAILDVFETWSAALGSSDTADIPGVVFLRMWLRRGTLEPMLVRELGREALLNRWAPDGRARLKAWPLGVVGHWAAGNVEIQPVLSMTCSLLGGNASLVRIPTALTDQTLRLLQKMMQSDEHGILTARVALCSFDHDREDLQEAMARAVDGAMIWGGAEAIRTIRALPFPARARLACFGPRMSAAAMDAETWCDSQERKSWCQRLARDVWQFDQQACSSPQVLFLEAQKGHSPSGFLQDLKVAFEVENRFHPRQAIQAATTSSICRARASWSLEQSENLALFPMGPDWTILFGRGSALPLPTQGKVLTVLEVDDLCEPIAQFDGTVQTLGLAIKDREKEEKLTAAAAMRGVDRIVKLGRMHVFAAPWDGVDLIRTMVRMVRHVRSSE